MSVEKPFKAAKYSTYYKNTNKIPHHLCISLQYFFATKGTIYHEEMAMVIFPHVKITCYLHMFLHKSSPGISLMFIAKEQPLEDTRLQSGSLIQPCVIVPGTEKISNWCNSHNGNVRIQRKRTKEQRMYCFRGSTWYRTENPQAVYMLVSPTSILSSTNHWMKKFICIIWAWLHICALIFFYCLTKSLQLILESLQPTDYFRYLLDNLTGQ